MPRRRLAVLAVIIVALAGIGAVLFLPLVPAREFNSPDGEFTAIVRTALVHSLVPVMPGHGSDRPGTLTVYRKDGTSCGTAELDMISEAYDLLWDFNAKSRLARLGWAVVFNLDTCKLESGG